MLTSVVGTTRKTSAPQRFRQLSGVDLPCRRRTPQARSYPQLPLGSCDPRHNEVYEPFLDKRQGLAFLPPAWSALLLQGLRNDHQLLSDASLATLLFAFGVAFAFGGDFVVFGALAVTFVGLRALGVTTIGWAVAFAINSWALTSSSTACV